MSHFSLNIKSLNLKKKTHTECRCANLNVLTYNLKRHSIKVYFNRNCQEIFNLQHTRIYVTNTHDIHRN